jgi:hypothetical protein
MARKDPYDMGNQNAIPAPFDSLIPHLFRSWDNPHTNVDNWLQNIAPDCVVKFGGHVSAGHDGIRAMRAGFVDPVKGPCVDLEHNLITCWVPAGGADHDTQAFIIKSSIWYQLVNGRKIEAECTSCLEFAAVGTGSWQVKTWEVFMSTLEIFDAIKTLQDGPK